MRRTSCFMSSARNAASSYLPKHPYPYVNHEPKRDSINLKPHATPMKFANPILRLRTSRFTYPLAALSSFADAEGHEHEEMITTHQREANAEEKKTADNDADLPGMAQAFHISSNTAKAISICIAFAALTFPFFMKTLGGLTLKTKLLSYATLLFGFYMAWNIGANDVANAMGTSVGSGALTLRQAVVTAAVLEFSGAFLMGSHVTSTMQKGILVANVFQGKDTLQFAGLLSSLAAAGISF